MKVLVTLDAMECIFKQAPKITLSLFGHYCFNALVFFFTHWTKPILEIKPINQSICNVAFPEK